MATRTYKVRFWGVRGSIATPVRENMRYGGNTSSLALALDPTEHLLLDCGTGACSLGTSLMKGPDRPQAAMGFHIFFTHYHLDHVEGLRFFAPLHDPESTLILHGPESSGISMQKVLESLIAPPYFPAPLSAASAKVRFAPLDGAPILLGDVRVTWQHLHHPQGSVAYRLERGDRSIVYATDHEHGDEAKDLELVRFAQDADTLIYDAQYVRSEYESRYRGWGHSTWNEGVRIARAARAKTLCLFHHHPMRTDAEVDALLQDARRELPGVEAACEGMEILL